jgi:hypothetical protein
MCTPPARTRRPLRACGCSPRKCSVRRCRCERCLVPGPHRTG